MTKEMEQAQEKIERILKAHIGSRDSDRALILEYMLGHTGLKNLPEKVKLSIVKAVYCEMPSFETITRLRRKIQSDGRYLGAMNTRELRKTKAKAMKAMFK